MEIHSSLNHSIMNMLLQPFFVNKVKSLLILHSALTHSYWHYRVHPQDLSDITDYIHRTILTLISVSTGFTANPHALMVPLWIFTLDPQVFTDITVHIMSIFQAKSHGFNLLFIPQLLPWYNFIVCEFYWVYMNVKQLWGKSKLNEYLYLINANWDVTS